MPEKQSSPTSATRKPRADAQRNRERILEVARHVFTQHGAEATLDDIARQANIGPGTLYRHFPTRDALIEAVYRSEVEKLTAAGRRLIEGARGLIHRAFVTLVQRAIDSGDLRPDADPNDFVRALVGVFHTTALPGWEASARRIVEILIAGSRPAHEQRYASPRALKQNRSVYKKTWS